MQMKLNLRHNSHFFFHQKIDFKQSDACVKYKRVQAIYVCVQYYLFVISIIQ